MPAISGKKDGQQSAEGYLAYVHGDWRQRPSAFWPSCFGSCTERNGVGLIPKRMAHIVLCPVRCDLPIVTFCFELKDNNGHCPLLSRVVSR
jgi:hypothetical protein